MSKGGGGSVGPALSSVHMAQRTIWQRLKGRPIDRLEYCNPLGNLKTRQVRVELTSLKVYNFKISRIQGQDR